MTLGFILLGIFAALAALVLFGIVVVMPYLDWIAKEQEKVDATRYRIFSPFYNSFIYNEQSEEIDALEAKIGNTFTAFGLKKIEKKLWKIEGRLQVRKNETKRLQEIKNVEKEEERKRLSIEDERKAQEDEERAQREKKYKKYIDKAGGFHDEGARYIEESNQIQNRSEIKEKINLAIETFEKKLAQLKRATKVAVTERDKQYVLDLVGDSQGEIEDYKKERDDFVLLDKKEEQARKAKDLYKEARTLYQQLFITNNPLPDAYNVMDLCLDIQKQVIDAENNSHFYRNQKKKIAAFGLAELKIQVEALRCDAEVITNSFSDFDNTFDSLDAGRHDGEVPDWYSSVVESNPMARPEEIRKLSLKSFVEIKKSSDHGV